MSNPRALRLLGLELSLVIVAACGLEPTGDLEPSDDEGLVGVDAGDSADSAPDASPAPPSPCVGISCSEHGTCMVVGNLPQCDCDDGFEAIAAVAVRVTRIGDRVRLRAPGVTPRTATITIGHRRSVAGWILVRGGVRQQTTTAQQQRSEDGRGIAAPPPPTIKRARHVCPLLQSTQLLDSCNAHATRERNERPRG